MAPVLTILANAAGILGGSLVCVGVYGVEVHFYWQHTRGCIEVWDLVTGLIKSACFGWAIALSSCYHGFSAAEGPLGLRRAVTRASVSSFAAVLVLDFFLSLFLNTLFGVLNPATVPRYVRFW